MIATFNLHTQEVIVYKDHSQAARELGMSDYTLKKQENVFLSGDCLCGKNVTIEQSKRGRK